MNSDDSKTSSSSSDSEHEGHSQGPTSPLAEKSKSKSRSRSPNRNINRSALHSDHSRTFHRSTSSSSEDENEKRRGPKSPPTSLPVHKEMRRGPTSPKSPLGSDSDNNHSKSNKNSRKMFRKSSRSSSASSSQKSRRRQKSNNGSSSDSSMSSIDSSSRKNKNITKPNDNHTEDVSEGDVEFKHQNEPKQFREDVSKINPEDLSDVSDLDDSIGIQSDDEKSQISKERGDECEDKKHVQNGNVDNKEIMEKKDCEKQANNPSRQEDGEEQLDFEAEDGECEEPRDTKTNSIDGEIREAGEEDPEKPKEDLEEGEVTDEDEARPEETEPRPVCRFFSRGACTWGANCRFLHPGVTDKGNYTMFDMVRPLVPEFGVNMIGRMDERLYKMDQPAVESAWERGLRTAKEMLRKSMKRKEQDIDFEEKKMNLSIAQEEFDKENGYYGRLSPTEPRYVRLPEYVVPRPQPHPEEYYGRRQVLYEPEYAPVHPVRREHTRSYREGERERIPHRSAIPPEHYTPKYDEEVPQPHSASSTRRKSKREVIVQRAPEERRKAERSERTDRPERSERRPNAGQRPDEWSDPWMRSKSPGRGRTRKRSYSSGSSSYSSSSSRSSSESSKSSRSPSLSPRRRRGGGGGAGGLTSRGRQVSPSIIVSERKAANERAALMNPPAPKRRVPSPGMMRVNAAANPPAPTKDDSSRRDRSKLAVAAALARVKRDTRKSSRSSSGSSSGSSSESESSSSSTTSSRSPSPKPTRKAVEIVKAMDALKGNALEKTKIKLNLKTPISVKKVAEEPAPPPASKKRGATSPAGGDSKSKKATSRREELLKQLKAVEDAIAKKRSKV